MSRGECLASDEERALCPLDEPYSDVHHQYYPSTAYRRPLEKEFRELPIHKVRLCRCIHNAIHAMEEIPEKPAREVMAEAIADYAQERERVPA